MPKHISWQQHAHAATAAEEGADLEETDFAEDGDGAGEPLFARLRGLSRTGKLNFVNGQLVFPEDPELQEQLAHPRVLSTKPERLLLRIRERQVALLMLVRRLFSKQHLAKLQCRPAAVLQVWAEQPNTNPHADREAARDWLTFWWKREVSGEQFFLGTIELPRKMKPRRIYRASVEGIWLYFLCLSANQKSFSLVVAHELEWLLEKYHALLAAGTVLPIVPSSNSDRSEYDLQPAPVGMFTLKGFRWALGCLIAAAIFGYFTLRSIPVSHLLARLGQNHYSFPSTHSQVKSGEKRVEEKYLALTSPTDLPAPIRAVSPASNNVSGTTLERPKSTSAKRIILPSSTLVLSPLATMSAEVSLLNEVNRQIVVEAKAVRVTFESDDDANTGTLSFDLSRSVKVRLYWKAVFHDGLSVSGYFDLPHTPAEALERAREIVQRIEKAVR